MFCHVYPGLDPDQETLARYYGLLNLTPDRIKLEWGYGGEESLEDTAERMAQEAERMARWETLGN
jgi:hypothetical protein